MIALHAPTTINENNSGVIEGPAVKFLICLMIVGERAKGA